MNTDCGASGHTVKGLLHDWAASWAGAEVNNARSREIPILCRRMGVISKVVARTGHTQPSPCIIHNER